MNTGVIILLIILATLVIGIVLGYITGFARGVASPLKGNIARQKRIMRRIFSIGGIVMVAIGIAMAAKTKWFIEHANRTEGTISELVATKSKDNQDLFAPKFSFLDAEGVSHTVESRRSSRPALFHVGEKVGVLYDSADPQSAKINTFGELWFGPIFISIFGLVLPVMAWLTFWFEKRNAMNQQMIPAELKR